MNSYPFIQRDGNFSDHLLGGPIEHVSINVPNPDVDDLMSSSNPAYNIIRKSSYKEILFKKETLFFGLDKVRTVLVTVYFEEGMTEKEKKDEVKEIEPYLFSYGNRIKLFLLDDGELICISEYVSTSGAYLESELKSRRDAYIVSSGEYYCGGDDKTGVSLVVQ